MTTILPYSLTDITTKVRKITARPSASQISDAEILTYINTFYVFDMSEYLRLESLRVNYKFTTTANIPVYDFPKELYLTDMPPVYIGGYQSYMTQSRENYFRINPQLNFLQQSVATGNGGISYSGTLTQTPITPGFKPNPPGAYSISVESSATDIAASYINYNVIFSALGTPDATSGISPSITLIDDGQGNLFAPTDTSTDPTNNRGTINYITGAFNITNFQTAIPSGNAINAQYVPYVASRPQSCVFYQDQIYLYPIPDQGYIVSFEAYKYPFPLNSDPTNGQVATDPQLREWWQLLAYGAACKIFSDNADFENLAKYSILRDEQMKLVQRRTIVQQTSERTATIYTEQSQFPQYPFGNLFSGF